MLLLVILAQLGNCRAEELDRKKVMSGEANFGIYSNINRKFSTHFQMGGRIPKFMVVTSYDYKINVKCNNI